MDDELKLNETDAAFETLEYPTTPAAAAAAVDDVTLLLADRERHQGSLLECSDADAFDSPDDLESELHNLLPREAVGEPYQSEGEG